MRALWPVFCRVKGRGGVDAAGPQEKIAVGCQRPRSNTQGRVLTTRRRSRTRPVIRRSFDGA